MATSSIGRSIKIDDAAARRLIEVKSKPKKVYTDCKPEKLMSAADLAMLFKQTRK